MKKNHPDRVIVSRCGYAVTLDDAEQRGFRVDYILERNDGWTLGTPEHLYQEAWNLWPNHWVAVHRVTPEETGNAEKEHQTQGGEPSKRTAPKL